MINRPLRYLRQSTRWRRRFPAELTVKHLWRWYSAWGDSLGKGRSPLTDECPWMTFAAIELLESVVRAESTVFEYGAGGSTVFLARRARHVVSVEHDRQWFAMVEQQLDKQGVTNWEGKLIEPTGVEQSSSSNAADPEQYVSSDPKYRDCSFQAYASAIDEFDDAAFDLVIVDGRARPACFRHALPKVRPGGYLLLDNSDREHYRSASQLASRKWRLIELPGPSPYVNFFTQTTAWQRAA